MLEFLRAQLPQYLDLPGMKSNGRCAALAAFWNHVIPAFWAKFTAEDAAKTSQDDSTVEKQDIDHPSPTLGGQDKKKNRKSFFSKHDKELDGEPELDEKGGDAEPPKPAVKDVQPVSIKQLFR